MIVLTQQQAEDLLTPIALEKANALQRKNLNSLAKVIKTELTDETINHRGKPIINVDETEEAVHKDIYVHERILGALNVGI